MSEKTDKETREHQRYLRSIRGRGSSSTAVQPGVSRATFEPERMTPDRINVLYRELLGGLVTDPDMLELVIENIDKFKNNFSFKTTVHGLTKEGVNTTLGTIQDIGNRTLQTYLYDYLFDDAHLIATGNQFDSQWKMKATPYLKLGGQDITVLNNGRITRVETEVTYTRGKAA